MARLMKQQGLKSKSQRPCEATTHSRHGRPVAPNRLGQQLRLDRPDTVYASDITCLPTEGDRLYRAVFLDLYSRAVTSWAIGHLEAPAPSRAAGP